MLSCRGSGVRDTFSRNNIYRGHMRFKVATEPGIKNKRDSLAKLEANLSHIEEQLNVKMDSK